MEKTWKYYNHAMVSLTAPHEQVDMQPLLSGAIWKNSNKPLLARWTTEFDCGVETEWWYVIKDTPFHLTEVKAKRRYEINKGNKNFTVRKLETEMLKEYAEELCDVHIAALSSYPKKHRTQVDRTIFVKNIYDRWNNNLIYGAFDKETEKLCGYALLTVSEHHVNFNILKARSEYEKRGLNAAIVYQILEDFQGELKSGFYISDGERNISHETAFQDYLEKYFGFRKAYCKLHIQYRKPIGLLVKTLYPFRKVLKKLDNSNFTHNIIAVLYMEELRKSFE